MSRWHRRLEHGYPTPWLGRDEVLREVEQALHADGIYSRGRFGAWKYEVSNQDHSLMQGVEAVERILDGAAERTYNGDMSSELYMPILSLDSSMLAAPLVGGANRLLHSRP